MYYDFWEMTIGEVVDYINGYNQQQRYESRKLYLLADLISSFVWTRYSGKKVPLFEEIFPADMVDENKSNDDTHKQIRALMEVFMINHNAQRRKKHGGDEV